MRFSNELITALTAMILVVLSTASAAQNIEKIISKMSLEEKIDFIGGYKSFYIRGYEHLGIPEIKFADGPVGVRNYGKSTAYPAGIALAASFDKDLARRVGRAIGMEARAKNVHVMLAPGMNIYRVPLCGRNFEYFGEDPFLAGQIATEYIKGIQSQGVMATAKHYAANNQEWDRHKVSSDVDERTLHEIYLPAFKAAVQKGKAASVMTSYNLINGVHASQNDYLINEILKGKWGFKGFVMSDWVSTYDGIACAKGGLDLEMPDGKMMNRETLIPAIKSGELSESVIDDKIRRILNAYKRFGFFENPDISAGFELDEEFVRRTALEEARGGMVLLKNENSFLPLDKSQLKKVAVIGPNGDPAVTGGGGSSKVDPLHPLSFYEAVKQIAGNGVDVIYEQGIYTGVELPEDIFDSFDFYYYENGKKVKGVEAEYFKGMKLEGDPVLKKTYPKLALFEEDMWNEPGVPKTNYSARFSCYYTPEHSGNYIIAASGDDGYRVFLDDVEVISMWQDQGDTPAKHEAFLNGGQEYKVVLEYYQNGGEAKIRLGAKQFEMSIDPESLFDNAVKSAEEADLVFMSVGFSGKTEGEGRDRTFELPFEQSELIKAIAAINKNTVVVLNAGGNVEMDSWIGMVPALLMAWYPGQEGNLAAAEILFGETNPSGKLPASFARTIEENPAYENYFDPDGDLRVSYDEGIFLGYRYWDQTDSKPRFPFGYGLSYTSFEYSELNIDASEFEANGIVRGSVSVKNTGNLDGAEIVQIYIGDRESSLPRPEKELKDFAKVFLKKGESKTVSFELPKNAFKFYDPQIHDWIFEPGEFEIIAASSSEDIRLSRFIILD